MAFSKILFDVADGVATLRLNDPARLNAVSTEMIEEMRAVIEGVARSARAMVLAGSDKAFCSGANLAGGRLEAIGPDFDMGAGLLTRQRLEDVIPFASPLIQLIKLQLPTKLRPS